MKTIELTCQTCKKLYEAKRVDGKYCSQYCRSHRYRQRVQPLTNKRTGAWRYGITLEEYLELDAKRDMPCEICGKTDIKGLHIDHDHKSKQIRGMICRMCNHALGMLGDDVSGLEKALDYLKKSETYS